MRWQSLFRRVRSSRTTRTQPRPRCRPTFEDLEIRLVPTVYNVNSTLDLLTPPQGVVTLRSAIEMANQSPGPNTILLNVPGTYRITLPGANEDNNATGDFDILPSGGNLSIVNASGSHVAIDGGGLDRVFDINPAASTTPFTVTFQGITIQNGHAAPGDLDKGSGGGIRAQGGASVVLTNVVLDHNYATADGGGIALESVNNDSTGTLVINSSVVSNNHAGDAGGGVEIDGTGQVSINPGTVITENTCVNQGAGVWLDAGGANLVIIGTLVSHNTAITMLAGGIGNAGNGNVTIISCTVEDNFAGGVGGGFGQAANTTGNLVVQRSVFLDNISAADGGGIQTLGPDTTITDSILASNTAAGNGGGLAVTGMRVLVTNTLFQGNDAVNGGAIEDMAGALNLTTCTLRLNTATGTNGGMQNTAGPGGDGGALDVETAATSVTIANCLFLFNTAANGMNGNGGAIFQAVGTLTVTSSQFTGNTASGSGGAINFAGPTFTITGTTFNDNHATNIGGAFDFSNQTVNANAPASLLTNDTFTANSASFFGGAIELNGFGTVNLLNDTINGNSGKFSGGGIEFSSFPLTVSFQNTIVALNTAGGASQDLHTGIGNPIVVDNGGNLIGTFNANITFGPNTLRGNPKLGPLENNGGQFAGEPGSRQVVLTEALLPGSTAIAAGLAAGAPKTDERGFPRPGGGAAQPGIGAFEPQFGPGSSANQGYVENVYETLLSRQADPGASYWVNLLNQGISPLQLIQSIEGSTEYRTDEVQSLYQHYLHRAADPAGLQVFVHFLQSGGLLEQVINGLVGSDEYFGLHGSSTDGFLQALYLDGLSRTPDSTGQAGFSQLLASGNSRASVVNMLFSSPEYIGDVVNNSFQGILGRTVDVSGFTSFTKMLQAGSSDEFILALILGSGEAVGDRA